MSQLILPEIPKEYRQQAVAAWLEPVWIDTYAPLPPDKNPMFLGKRVYQGSSGRVYPLPFYQRIADRKVSTQWKAIHMENRYLRLMLLPQIGGRIHVALDKTNGYDFIYRQNVIKPALVGLAGPWISGGIEFNWPQHHRPGTFMPTDVHIQDHADGSKTVWMSEHEPMNRLKGMHGVCLHPGKAYIELKVRLYNRTETPQTFLWWANVATRVHEKYQSFFPPDVLYVADHAKRAMSSFPECTGKYYGVDYAQRARYGVSPGDMPRQFVPPGDYPPNDLSWYANIPVPTSYMAMGSRQDFFGGYDHVRKAGIIHIANHHLAPGKKQWTWGNHDFGYAWDRNLTDDDGPYIELMAGVYTDNQPDFSFLEPGETRTFSQYWYPIQAIGPAHQANLNGAVSLTIGNGHARVGISVTQIIPGARITLMANGQCLAQVQRDLVPGSPMLEEVVRVDSRIKQTDLQLTVEDRDRRIVLAYHPSKLSHGPVPPAATEPPVPGQIVSSEELYITGVHLEQYRHPTRSPVAYWQEALRRDPLDIRCNQTMGLWHYRRGEFSVAETHFRKAIERQTRRNPNPPDGGAYYYLGLVLRRMDRNEEAYDAFYKATWNRSWQAPAYHALAELDAKNQNWDKALMHLDQALTADSQNSKARNLKAIALRELGQPEQADRLLQETLSMDPLDFWARYLQGQKLTCDSQVCLDISLDMAQAGLYQQAWELLSHASERVFAGTEPLVEYYRGEWCRRMGKPQEALKHYRKASKLDPAYCFPARLDEIQILQEALKANPHDASGYYYIGNLFYDRQRYDLAIIAWQKTVKLKPMFATAWRNLGIAYFNVLHDPAKAKRAYDRAVQAGPNDARLVYERDQLWKRLAYSPDRRLAELNRRLKLVMQRDDLSLEYVSLLNQTRRHDQAAMLLAKRRFQPWEGGEGVALGQHVQTYLALGRRALERNDVKAARVYFAQALESPPNLGEAKHLLRNSSNVHYWLGLALSKGGDIAQARRHWQTASTFEGDFQSMAVRTYSTMTYYQALALEKLGEKTSARELLQKLLAYAKQLEKPPVRIDYFATSLPMMLLFEDDLQFRQITEARLMQAQAYNGLGKTAISRRLLADVLKQDPNHPEVLVFDSLLQIKSPRACYVLSR